MQIFLNKHSDYYKHLINVQSSEKDNSDKLCIFSLSLSFFASKKGKLELSFLTWSSKECLTWKCNFGSHQHRDRISNREVIKGETIDRKRKKKVDKDLPLATSGHSSNKMLKIWFKCLIEFHVICPVRFYSEMHTSCRYK